MSWTDPAFERAVSLLGARTGLVFAPARHPGAELGIRRALARSGLGDLPSYLDALARDEALLDDLIVELTIPETYFFREPGQFDFLRRVALPSIRARRAPDLGLRAWSAGCASGEEPYSLAMMLEEEEFAATVPVLATDISRAALARGRAARYGAWSLRGEGAQAARPHLSADGDRFVVADPIRRRVAFEHLNLALEVYPSFATGTWGTDLILCRNVLIYFDPETVRAVIRRFHDSLAEGGWLIVASSDPMPSDHAPFEVVATNQGLFYRRRPAGSAVDLGVGADLTPVSATFESVSRTPWTSSLAPPTPTGDGSERLPSLPSLLLEERPRSGPDGIPSTPPPPTLLVEEGGRRGAIDPGDGRDPAAEACAAARADLARGDYAQAAARTLPYGDDAGAVALHVRALANLDPAAAERAAAAALGRHPFSAELHHLRAVLLSSLDRAVEAAGAARRVIYLDRTLAIAHFLLGTILRQQGDHAAARRAFRNARDLSAARPADEVVALSDGEPAGRLADSARRQIAALDALALATEARP